MPGFVKNKSCQINLISFCCIVTRTIDTENLIDKIYPDFAQTIEAVLHNTEKYSLVFIYLFLNFLLNIIIIFYCCSSTVVSIFFPPLPPTPAIPTSHPQSYPLWLCPCVLYTCCRKPLPRSAPLSPAPPLWLVSILFFFNFYFYSVTVVCLFSPSLHPTELDFVLTLLTERGKS